ncbi:MAG: ATP synthase subunit I [Aridibacter sp.]
MSEESEYLKSENEGIEQLSHKRLLFIMAVLTVLGSVLGFVYVSTQFGVGIILGGILSFINYYWLKHSLKVFFDGIINNERPGFIAVGHILRYVIFGLILLIIFLSKAVSIVAVILGLASFAFAVVVEGIIRIFKSFNK